MRIHTSNRVILVYSWSKNLYIIFINLSLFLRFYLSLSRAWSPNRSEKLELGSLKGSGEGARWAPPPKNAWKFILETVQSGV